MLRQHINSSVYSYSSKHNKSWMEFWEPQNVDDGLYTINCTYEENDSHKAFHLHENSIKTLQKDSEGNSGDISNKSANFLKLSLCQKGSVNYHILIVYQLYCDLVVVITNVNLTDKPHLK